MLSKNLKSSKNNQKAVFIDWNGTLSPSNFWSHLEKSQKRSDRNLFKSWTGSMFVNHKDKIVPWMRGKYTSENLLSLVSKETNTNYKSILKEFITGCELMEYSSPNIPSLISKMRSKSVIVAIATNNMDCFSRWTVPHMKLNTLFNEIFNSYDMKVMKHDQDERGQSLFFRDFFSKYNVEPNNCIFIDDGVDKKGVIGSLGMEYRRLDKSSSLEQELESILAML